MAYYKSKEYKIVIGNSDSGTALCVGWRNASNFVNAHPVLTDQCAIIGSLYSAQGINAMIRNLALNPGIRVLYLWRQDEDSLTERGVYATNILLKLWDEGVNDLRMCDDFTLEKEIPLDVFNTVRSSVKIQEIYEVAEKRALTKIESLVADLYMEPCSFPDPEYEAPQIFPSEKAGFAVHAKTVYDAWLKVLYHVGRFGDLHTSNGIQTKRLLSIIWVAESELEDFPACTNMPEALVDKLFVAPDHILDYAKNHFLECGEVDSGSYSYSDRMYRWDGYFDQIAMAISRLREDPTTRQVYVSISMPNYDLSKSIQPPCMVGVQFLHTGDALDALAVFRSQDIFQAGLSNAFGILHLLRFVAKEVNMRQGRVVITTHDAHIYFRDMSDARQLVECVWESKPIALTEEDMDPRGSFLVEVSERRIIVDVVNVAGQRLDRISGTSANVICRKMAPLYLIGPDQSGHACYLGMELMKAEWCLRNGKEYIQDETLW